MDIKKIKNILRMGESQSIEFKKNFGDEVIETLCAFANTKGGKIFLGVSDDGKIGGLKIVQETLQGWINEIKNKTNPSLFPDIETLSYSGKEILIFSIEEYPVKPVSFRGRYYKRVKNSNHVMGVDEVVRIHLQTFNSSWDYHLDPSHSMEDISLEKVDKFIHLVNQNKDTPITDDALSVLRKFELLRSGKISHACFLLFMKEESLLSAIEIGRFQTETLIKDSIRIKTDLFSELEGVLGFIKKHLNKEYIISGNAQRQERWEYPLEALREIIINAIVHRDYSKSSDSVIKIFDDRIEFYNPGRLTHGLTISKLIKGDYVSTIRNKQIADLFKEAGMIEKYGSGIKRVIEAFKKYGLKSPKFKEVQDGFLITVYRKTPQKTPQNTPQKTPQINPPEVQGKVSLSRKILRVVEEDPTVTREMIAQKLSISRETVKEYIQKLRKEGVLERIGSDRGGYWKLKNQKEKRL